MRIPSIADGTECRFASSTANPPVCALVNAAMPDVSFGPIIRAVRAFVSASIPGVAFGPASCAANPPACAFVNAAIPGAILGPASCAANPPACAFVNPVILGASFVCAMLFATTSISGARFGTVARAVICGNSLSGRGATA